MNTKKVLLFISNTKLLKIIIINKNFYLFCVKNDTLGVNTYQFLINLV